MVRGAPRGHGRHIYAYCNVRTNQVLYSLERTLRNAHLAQLADVGANYNPPKLRKDIWRPLWTVSLPDTADAPQQGLELFRHLREYRMLHETNWEIPDEMKRPFTEKEIEEKQRKLDDRGGSKKESVYDIIKREKWKMRVKMVMDQKANSIADLAAILLRQEEKGATVGEEQTQALQSRREQDENAMVALASANATEAESLKGQIPGLEAEVTEAEQLSQDKNSTSKDRRAAFQKALHTRRHIEKLRLEIRRMEWCAAQVAEAKAQALAEQQAEEEAAAAAAAATSNSAGSATSQEAADSEKPATPAREIDFRQFLPDFPPELDTIAAAKAGLRVSKGSALRPSNKKQRDLAKLVKAPIFTAQGVVVKWANMLDAEFAETWPIGVKHDRLGFVRNTAPKPDADPIDDVETFMGMNKEDQDPDELAQEKAAREQRKAIIKSIGEKIVGNLTQSPTPFREKAKAKAKEKAKEKAEAKKAVANKHSKRSEDYAQPGESYFERIVREAQAEDVPSEPHVQSHAPNL